tara:strand:+ start:290 stop:1147 length:858 start_codon:yes stop_codon:yes gene_type:complete
MAYKQTKTIGGTAVSAILGVNKWATPWDAWRRILHGVQAETNEAMERGLRLEGPIAEVWAMARGQVLVEPSGTRIVDGVFSATADREVYEGGKLTALVEIKTAGTYGVLDPLPLHYQLQVQHYLWAYDVDVAHLVGLKTADECYRMLDTYGDVDFALRRGAAKLVHHEIQRDPEYAETVIPFLRDWFERHIVNEEPPAVDGSDGCRHGLFDLYRDRMKESVAEPDLDELLLQRQQVRTAEAEHKSRRDLVENKIRAKMADRRKVRGSGVSCTLSKNNRLTFKEID